MFRVLIFGDIVAKPGRKALAAVLPELKKQCAPQLTIANAENIAHGVGVTTKTIGEAKAAGVDFFTSGDHVWSRKEAVALLKEEVPIMIRPANYPPGVAGRGAYLLTVGKTPVLIANFIGRVFMHHDFDCPFRGFDALEAEMGGKAIIKIVDFHAEATSEKIAFGQYCDGRASIVFGTHTHVPTADAQILPAGTAYVSDVGMTGLKQSVIGANAAMIREMFLTQINHSEMHDTEESGAVIVNAIVVDIDETTGKAHSIERIQKEVVV